MNTLFFIMSNADLPLSNTCATDSNACMHYFNTDVHFSNTRVHYFNTDVHFSNTYATLRRGESTPA